MSSNYFKSLILYKFKSIRYNIYKLINKYAKYTKIIAIKFKFVVNLNLLSLGRLKYAVFLYALIRLEIDKP